METFRLNSLILLALVGGCNLPGSGPNADALNAAADVATVQAYVRADIDQYPVLGPGIEPAQVAQEAPPNPLPPKDLSPGPGTGDVLGVSPEVLNALGDAVEKAAESEKAASSSAADPSKPSVYFFTHPGCSPCIPEKLAFDSVRRKIGSAVIEVDGSLPENAELMRKYSIGAYPTWIVQYPESGKYQRFTGQGSNTRIPTLKAPSVAQDASPLVAGGFTGPTVKVADVLPLVAGKEIKLGDKATLRVPADVKWTVAQKDGKTVLSFSRKPTLVVHKILDWKLSLEGIEITTSAVTLQIDNLPDVTVRVDWSSK